MRNQAQMAINFKGLVSKYGWFVGSGIMFMFILYKTKKEELLKNQKLKKRKNTNKKGGQGQNESEHQNQQLYTEKQENYNEGNPEESLYSQEMDLKNDVQDYQEQYNAKLKRNYNNNSSNISNSPSTIQNMQNKKKQIGIGKRQHQQQMQQSESEEDYEDIITSLKRPMHKDDIVKLSKSQMQQSFLKKSRAQHFDEEDRRANQYYSDIDNRQSNLLKSKFRGDSDIRQRQFASDQDEDSTNQYQRNQLQRIIKEQDDEQDKLFFKIYGGLIIDEKDEEFE